MSYYDYFKKRKANNPYNCDELTLWLENDRAYEEQILKKVRGKYISRIQKGTFDKKLGVKGLVNWITVGIAYYNRDPHNEDRISLTVHDKELVAKLFFDYMWTEYLSKVKSEVPPKPTRRFSNETYKFLKRYKRKTEAETAKNRVLKAGKKCRIFHSKDGYDLYVRGR